MAASMRILSRSYGYDSGPKVRVEFLKALADECRKRGFNLKIDANGYRARCVPTDGLRAVLKQLGWTRSTRPEFKNGEAYEHSGSWFLMIPWPGVVLYLGENRVDVHARNAHVEAIFGTQIEYKDNSWYCTWPDTLKAAQDKLCKSIVGGKRIGPNRTISAEGICYIVSKSTQGRIRVRLILLCPVYDSLY